MAKQVQLGKYPYAATRVKVMKSLLIKRADYAKLLKMELPEIAAFLQQTTYKKEINELGLKHADVELIEKALNRNLANTAKKLLDITIAYPELQVVIGTYLKRLDIYNIKQIIRGKFAELSDEEIIESLIPNGGLSFQTLKELMKKESLLDIISSVDDSEETRTAVKKFDETKNLQSIENMLDLHYYERVEDVAQQVRGDELLERYMEEEIDVLNAKILLRLKKQQMPAKEILSQIHAHGRELTKGKMEELAQKSLEDTIKELQKMKIGKELGEAMKHSSETRSLVALETALDKTLMKRSTLFLHEKPLSVNPIIGFLIAKEAEIRNIRMITRAKQHKLPEEFMEQQLIA